MKNKHIAKKIKEFRKWYGCHMDKILKKDMVEWLTQALAETWEEAEGKEWNDGIAVTDEKLNK